MLYSKAFTVNLASDWKIMLNLEPQLSDEQRALLIRKLEIDIELNRLKAELLPAMLDALKNPSKEKEETISFLSSVKLSELRHERQEIVDKLLKSAFDIQKLTEMLPSILMALGHGINLPLILKMFDIDPDQIKDLTELVKKYFSL